MVTIVEEEILLAEIVQRLGLKVEIVAPLQEAAFCVSAKSQEPQTVLRMVATAGNLKLDQTPTGWRISPTMPQYRSAIEAEYEAWIQPFRSLPSDRARDNRIEALNKAIQLEDRERKAGWQDRMARSHKELGSLELGAKMPALSRLAKAKERPPVGVTVLLPGEPLEAVRLGDYTLITATADMHSELALADFWQIAPPPIDLPDGPMPHAGRTSRTAATTLQSLAEAAKRPLVVRTFRDAEGGTIPDRISNATGSLWSFSLRDQNGWILGISQHVRERERWAPFIELRKIEAKAPFMTLDDAIAVAKAGSDVQAGSFVSEPLRTVSPIAPVLKVLASLSSSERDRLMRQEPLPLEQLSTEARRLAFRAIHEEADPLKLIRLVQSVGSRPETWGGPEWALHLDQVASPRKVRVRDGVEAIADFTQEGEGWMPATIREYTFRIGMDTKRSMSFHLKLTEPYSQ